MKVPHLNRSLTLETPIHTPDGAGGLHVTWKTLGIIWGHLQALNGAENPVEKLPVSQVSYRITVRAARPESERRPKPGQRFRIGRRIFEIEAVYEMDTHARYLSCVAREEVST